MIATPQDMDASASLEQTTDVAAEVSQPQPLTMRAIQAHVGGVLVGNPETVIIGVNGLEAAGADELTFAEHPAHAKQAHACQAAALIVPHTFPPLKDRTLLHTDHPRLAFTQVMHLFQHTPTGHPGVSRHAIVAPDVELGQDVTILECAVIRSRAQIGHGTRIDSGAHIGEGVIIGAQCVIGPNVVIRQGCQLGHRVILHPGVVIGADGFGYVWTQGHHLKIPQLGNVIIEDDVELGANVCVDRATFGSTLVKRGTKVDNLVQIAHNVVIGEHSILAGQVGLAGSVTVGNRAIFGGQVGVADHVTIGDDAKLGGASVVIHDIPAGATVWGYPARDLKTTKRELVAVRWLPELLATLRAQRRRPPLRRRRVRR